LLVLLEFAVERQVFEQLYNIRVNVSAGNPRWRRIKREGGDILRIALVEINKIKINHRGNKNEKSGKEVVKEKGRCEEAEKLSNVRNTRKM